MIVKTVVRPETEMKNSGIDWISSIPKDWKIPQVRNFFEINRGRVIAKTEINELYKEGLFPVYSSQTKDNGCMGYIDSYDFEKEGLTWTTDGAYAGTVFYRKGKYNCTNVCGILTLKDGFDVSVPFCKYSIGWSAMNCRRADINGYKIMSNEMAAIKFVMPPLSEQQAIADYLDETCSKIDEIIAEAKASIDEYENLRQSIIYEILTKGPDDNVEMKDSGVEWIGKVPSHWMIGKVKYGTTKVGSGKTPKGGAEVYMTSGVMFLRSQNIYNDGLRLDNPYYISEEIDEEMKNTRVQKNDVLLNITGGSIGRCCIFDGSIPNANVNQHVCIIRVNSSVFLPEYMHLFWISLIGQISIKSYQTGGNREGMSAEAIKNTPIPIIPIGEQRKIVDLIKPKIDDFNSLIAEKESLINDLEAYKKSLIYEVVTGKRRVV